MIAAIFGLAYAVFMFFLMIIMSTFTGGVVGWTVNLVFPFVISTINHIFSLNLTAFELGRRG